jgi:hypothetical protein
MHGNIKNGAREKRKPHESSFRQRENNTMKMTIRKFQLVVLAAALAGTMAASAESYTITITPGRFCFIANQLNNGGNTLNEVFPFTADQGVGSTLDWFDIGLQSMSAAQFDPDDLVWYPAGITLAPGGGALLDYQGSATTLTFTGTRVSSPVLYTPVAGVQQWVSDQLPEVGTWDTIMAVAPGAGTIVRTWDPMLPGLTGDGDWVANTFDGSTWSLGAPTAAVGEAWDVYYVAPVPEPTTTGCFLSGLIALVCFQRVIQNRRS